MFFFSLCVFLLLLNSSILHFLPFLLFPLQTLYTKQHLSRGPPRPAHKNRSSSSFPTSASSSFSSSLSKAEEDLFHERLGCLLFRYQALAATARDDPSSHDADNADERSLPPRVFDVLASLFGAQMECFASPFNCRYSVFCSSQWDLDGYFGSVGSFFAFRPLNGMYVAHPPPVPGVVESMLKVRGKREGGRPETWWCRAIKARVFLYMCFAEWHTHPRAQDKRTKDREMLFGTEPWWSERSLI